MTGKIKAAPMVYIQGEEMSGVAMREKDMLIDLLVKPHVDISAWEFFDFSVAHRKESDDKVVPAACKRISELGSAYKEQTITPNQEQKKLWGVTFGSPNHAIREAIDGYVIDRDTIHPIGAKCGYAKQVLTSRFPLGDGYSIKKNYAILPKAGTVKMVFVGADGKEKVIGVPVKLQSNSLVACLDTPLDGYADFFRHGLQRALDANVRYVYTDKGTAFVYQTEYFKIGKEVFENEFRAKFEKAGLMKAGDKFEAMLSDNAAMAMVGWKDGGFLLAGPNYEMDILADLVAKVQNDPAHVSSVLAGKKGVVHDAGHGTDPRNYQLWQEKGRDYFNPMSQAVGLFNAMIDAAKFQKVVNLKEITAYAEKAKAAVLKAVGENAENAKAGKGWTCQELLKKAAEYLK